MAQLDYGFKQSDKMLGELEQRLHKEYTQAAKEMEEKANKYFQRFQKEDAKKADAYQKGEITKKEYAEWRQREMLTGKRWADMKETLARHAVNTDKIAMSFVSDKIKDVYALNMNFGTYDIERVSGINTAFTLINQDAVKVLLKDNPQLLPSPKVDIAKDMRWNMQHINSAITQGILQGESIPKVAKRLQAVTGMDERAAIRNARTAMTGAQNAGRFDAIKRMNERGVVVKKVWIATLDNVTRDSHVDLDGEVVDYDQTFSNGLMYPADGTGAPEEVYNCRCRLGKEYDKYRTDWSDMRNRRDDKIKDMGYEEWKKQARDRLEMKGKAAKKDNQKVATNKNGEEIVFNFVIPQKVISKGEEAVARAEKRQKEAEELITNLSQEYDVYLTDVTNKRSGGGNEAGSVDAVGHMEIPSLAKDTVLHEFGHTFSQADRVKWDLADEKEVAFMNEAKKLYRQYKSEYQKNYAHGSMTIISNYSLETVDEFIAEGFTLAKGRELGFDLDKFLAHNANEHKYSDEILRLINKYFKR